jgi:urease accessory protein
MPIITEPFAGWIPGLLQLVDTVFPTGGYAHSFGLEEIVRRGEVRDQGTLEKFLQNRIVPALTHLDLPIVREAIFAAAAGDREEFIALDRLAGALKIAREQRDASLQMGRRRLFLLMRLRPTPELNVLHQIALDDPLAGHHAVVWGVSCASVPVKVALVAYYYQAVVSLCTAAPKLIRIGQEGAQGVLTQALNEAERCVDTAYEIGRSEIGWFDPALEIACMLHEIADERLFIS